MVLAAQNGFKIDRKMKQISIKIPSNNYIKKVAKNGPKRMPGSSQKVSKRESEKAYKKDTKIIHAGHAGFARSGTAVPSKPCGAAGPREQLKPYDHSTACHRARWRIIIKPWDPKTNIDCLFCQGRTPHPLA